MQPPQILSIQYLRAVAAIGIVIYHIGLRFSHMYTFGNAGVDNQTLQKDRVVHMPGWHDRIRTLLR